MTVTIPPPTDARRAAAKRTVWVLALVALAVYAAFIAAGVMGVAGSAS